MKNTKLMRHVVLALAATAGLATGCDGAGSRSQDELPPGLAAAMQSQRETLKKNATTLHAGAQTMVEKDGGMTQTSGPADGNPLRGYNLTVKTGAVDKAGTDANVYAELWHYNGGSSWTGAGFYLDHPGSYNDFERGRVDYFSVRGLTLGGKVDYVYVEHDNTSSNPGWYLEYMQAAFIDSRNQVATYCDFHQWLATDEPPYYSTNAARSCY